MHEHAAEPLCTSSSQNLQTKRSSEFEVYLEFSHTHKVTYMCIYIYIHNVYTFNSKCTLVLCIVLSAYILVVLYCLHTYWCFFTVICIYNQCTRTYIYIVYIYIYICIYIYIYISIRSLHVHIYTHIHMCHTTELNAGYREVPVSDFETAEEMDGNLRRGAR